MSNYLKNQDVICKTHNARVERQFRDIYRPCPSKLSKKELEDLYFKLLENNMEMKRTINTQHDKIRVLSTKLQRSLAVNRNVAGKERDCCKSKVQMAEQKDSLVELQKSNERLMDRIRVLNMKLCSVKQFGKKTPLQTSVSKTGFKNSSLSSLNNKTLMCENFTTGPTMVYRVENKRGQQISTDRSNKTVETEAVSDEEQDIDKNNYGSDCEPTCDENKCKTVMEELREKIFNMQKELLDSHKEYTERILSLETMLTTLRDDNLRLRTNTEYSKQDQEDIVKNLKRSLREMECQCSDYQAQLKVEKNRVQELETQMKMNDASSQVSESFDTLVVVNKTNVSVETEPDLKYVLKAIGMTSTDNYKFEIDPQESSKATDSDTKRDEIVPKSSKTNNQIGPNSDPSNYRYKLDPPIHIVDTNDTSVTKSVPKTDTEKAGNVHTQRKISLPSSHPRHHRCFSESSGDNILSTVHKVKVSPAATPKSQGKFLYKSTSSESPSRTPELQRKSTGPAGTEKYKRDSKAEIASRKTKEDAIADRGKNVTTSSKVGGSRPGTSPSRSENKSKRDGKSQNLFSPDKTKENSVPLNVNNKLKINPKAESSHTRNDQTKRESTLNSNNKSNDPKIRSCFNDQRKEKSSPDKSNNKLERASKASKAEMSSDEVKEDSSSDNATNKSERDDKSHNSPVLKSPVDHRKSVAVKNNAKWDRDYSTPRKSDQNRGKYSDNNAKRVSIFNSPRKNEEYHQSCHCFNKLVQELKSGSAPHKMEIKQTTSNENNPKRGSLFNNHHRSSQLTEIMSPEGLQNIKNTEHKSTTPSFYDMDAPSSVNFGSRIVTKSENTQIQTTNKRPSSPEGLKLGSPSTTKALKGDPKTVSDDSGYTETNKSHRDDDREEYIIKMNQELLKKIAGLQSQLDHLTISAAGAKEQNKQKDLTETCEKEQLVIEPDEPDIDDKCTDCTGVGCSVECECQVPANQLDNNRMATRKQSTQRHSINSNHEYKKRKQSEALSYTDEVGESEKDNKYSQVKERASNEEILSNKESPSLMKKILMNKDSPKDVVGNLDKNENEQSKKLVPVDKIDQNRRTSEQQTKSGKSDHNNWFQIPGPIPPLPSCSTPKKKPSPTKKQFEDKNLSIKSSSKHSFNYASQSSNKDENSVAKNSTKELNDTPEQNKTTDTTAQTDYPMTEITKAIKEAVGEFFLKREDVVDIHKEGETKEKNDRFTQMEVENLNQSDEGDAFCLAKTTICRCPSTRQREVSVFRTCSGTLRFRTAPAGVKFKTCSCQIENNSYENVIHSPPESITPARIVPTALPSETTLELPTTSTQTPTLQTTDKTQETHLHKVGKSQDSNDRRQSLTQHRSTIRHSIKAYMKDLPAEESATYTVEDKSRYSFKRDKSANREDNRYTLKDPLVSDVRYENECIEQSQRAPAQWAGNERGTCSRNNPHRQVDKAYPVPSKESLNLVNKRWDQKNCFTCSPERNARSVSPENTEKEISSFSDLPDEKAKTPRRVTSPGEEKTFTTTEESSRTDYGSLSEGELPVTNKLKDTPTDRRPSILRKTAIENSRSSTQRVELSLKTISKELEKCKELLRNRCPPECDKCAVYDAVRPEVSEAERSPRLALRPAAADSRLAGNKHTCVFTIHIGSLVLSDEAVLLSRNKSQLFLSWKFYDQSVTMTRVTPGRVMLFDYSTEYTIVFSDNFLDYMKQTKMPLVICELNKLEEPFAICYLPLRDALLNINRRADMSLALEAGSGLTDPTAGRGDEIGVLDLWCSLRTDAVVMQVVNQKTMEPSLENATPLAAEKMNSSLGNSAMTVGRATDDDIPTMLEMSFRTKENDRKIRQEMRQTSFKRSALNYEYEPDKSDNKSAPETDTKSNPEVAAEDSVASNLANRDPSSTKWRPSYLASIKQGHANSSVITSEIASNIRSTVEMKAALEKQVHEMKDDNISKDTDRVTTSFQDLMNRGTGKKTVKYSDSPMTPDQARLSLEDHPQTIDITVLWLALNEECDAMLNHDIQRLYVSYNFLGRTGADLETPMSLPKPKSYIDKCVFNFKKKFHVHEYDMPMLAHMARMRSNSKGSPQIGDCLVFTVVSEPAEDPLGLATCEDVGYGYIYLGDILAYSGDSNSYTEVVPVREARGASVCGVLAVRLRGLQVIRIAMGYHGTAGQQQQIK